MSEYILTIRSLPSAVPSTIRLRRLLKMALRTYQFRCTDYRLIDESHPECDKPRSITQGIGSATDVEKRSSDAATRKSESEK